MDGGFTMAEKLYYYCNASTFESILKNKLFWLTDVSKSNDYAEISVFFKEIEVQLSARQSNIIHDSQSMQSRYQSIYQSAIDILRKTEPQSYFFAMCFTSLNDNLSQWRAYGDDGRGFCIEIDSEKLRLLLRKFQAKEEMMYIKKVSYSAYDMKCKIDGLIRKIDEFAANENPSISIAEWCREWTKTVVNAAAYYKTEGFSAEQETRLCYSRIITPKQMRNKQPHSHLHKVHFKVNRNDCIPYMEFPIDKIRSVISGIVIGPRNQASEDIVKFMLANCNYDKRIEVKKSKVTYRGK